MTAHKNLLLRFPAVDSRGLIFHIDTPDISLRSQNHNAQHQYRYPNDIRQQLHNPAGAEKYYQGVKNNKADADLRRPRRQVRYLELICYGKREKRACHKQAEYRNQKIHKLFARAFE